MKKGFILWTLWLCGTQLIAQEIHSPVLISGGGYDEQASMSLDWTFGEVFADYEESGQISLTQGYYHASCINLEFSLETMNNSCFQSEDGLIIVNSENLLRLEYRLMELNFVQTGTQAMFTDLPAGEYTVRISDLDSCTVTAQKVVIDEPDDFSVDVIETQYRIRVGETVDLEAIGANSYRWITTTDTLTLAQTQIFTASPTQTTTYRVIGQVGECSKMADIQVDVMDFTQVKPHILISPNRDGLNDTWMIENIDLFPDAEIIVVNRWQQEVFRTTNYQNDWDGRFEGKTLPQGTYYYVITLAGTDNVLKGDINLIE